MSKEVVLQLVGLGRRALATVNREDGDVLQTLGIMAAILLLVGGIITAVQAFAPEAGQIVVDTIRRVLIGAGGGS